MTVEPTQVVRTAAQLEASDSELRNKLREASRKADLKEILAITSELSKNEKERNGLLVDAQKTARQAFEDALISALKAVNLPTGYSATLAAKKSDNGTLDDVSIGVMATPVIEQLRAALASAGDGPSTLKAFTVVMEGGDVKVSAGVTPRVRSAKLKGDKAEGKVSSGRGTQVAVYKGGQPVGQYPSLSNAVKTLIGETNPDTGKPWSPMNGQQSEAKLVKAGYTLQTGS